MGCIGDGWHKVGSNAKVYVKDRVIVQCLILDHNGEWKTAFIKKWNRKWHRYERIGFVTLAALRSGLARSTMTISC